MAVKASHDTVKFLNLSQRMGRTIVGLLLVAVVTTEALLPWPWLLALAALAAYTIVTGIFDWDPLLRQLRQSHPQLPDKKLSFTAQLECAAIGTMCIAAGILFRGSDSILLNVLPFLGIYPILICATKHDLLAYLLQSYRRDDVTRDTQLR